MYQLNFTGLLPYWDDFLRGALATLQMSLVATALGLVAGIILAIGRRSRTAWLRVTSGAYIETIRNTPYLIQIFFLFFGLSSVGLRLPIIVAAIVTLVINVAAYTAEIVRAGMESIHPSQIEAAQALGLTTPQIYWDVILRPALERVYPALTSQFVLMMLASSVTSQISAEELTAAGNNIQSETFLSFESFIVVAGLYVVLSALMKLIFQGLALLLFPRRRRLGTTL